MIAVVGMWHQGPVTAACLASLGHNVIAIDQDPCIIEGLIQGKPPVAEPGLAEMIASESHGGRLRFSTLLRDVSAAELIWIAYDTPVDENDVADVEFVHRQSAQVLQQAADDAVVVISSQMPVGSVARIEKESGGRGIKFVSAPENLRLGKAIELFLHPDRVVLGVRDQGARTVVEPVFAPITDRIEWMSIESAEMTKHAINAFLATSICFINEMAAVCEASGADAAEVERGLKSDLRIGQRAYLHAGGAIAGGTLIRDIGFLRALAQEASKPLPLIEGVHTSNESHKTWLPRKISEVLGDLRGRNISILGLTYKPGTDTLRRSPSVDLARWIKSEGANIQAYDPQVSKLPDELQSIITVKPNMASAMESADALVVMTAWPNFRTIDPIQTPRVVFDAARFLEAALKGKRGIRYFSIGSPN